MLKSSSLSEEQRESRGGAAKDRLGTGPTCFDFVWDGQELNRTGHVGGAGFSTAHRLSAEQHAWPDDNAKSQATKVARKERR